MYSIDGVSLDNPSVGWWMEGTSAPLFTHTAERTSQRVVGLPGVVADLEETLETLSPPQPTLVVQTPRGRLGALAALFAGGSVLSKTDDPSREARYEFLSVTPAELRPGGPVLNAAAMLRIPGVFWRDVATTTHTTAIGAATVTTNAWNMDGLVTDAVIRVRGAVTGLRVESGQRAYFEYDGSLTGSQYLRYECATGRAWLTATDTWSGGTEVSGQVSADGPAGKFGVFPVRLSAISSQARVTVKTATRSGAQIEIRGKGAHLE